MKRRRLKASAPWDEKYTVSESGCWEWAGYKDRDGYGNARGRMAHRVAYERVFGPIPVGVYLDHICRNRACVNPSHLEAVTPRTNTLRGISPVAVSVRSNRCYRGHEFTPENTIENNRSKGWRTCRTCRDLRRQRKADRSA